MSKPTSSQSHLLFLVFAWLGLLLPTDHSIVHAQTDLRDLNSHCPFVPPESLEEWKSRAEVLRLQLEVSLGLYPKLELDPVTPNIYGKIKRDDYSIEKVTFESLPGLFVTGNLYRPASTETDQLIPAILCPHGHWNEARFYDEKPSVVKQLLASGAERFETAARNHIQARCVQLARMGCIVFHWDMLGYCDSQQISHQRAHRFASQPRDDEITDEGWLLYSVPAESYGQSVLGLQSLATQRAVDMLLTLPEVDPERIAITGASGGGTQSFIGAALDDRIRVAFPAVMVSTGMQGGCTCENASLLRIGTGNVEMAALIAPKPLGLTAADDWTRTMPNDGFPELKKVYELFGVTPRAMLFPALHFGHNFNHVSRTHMYGWMSNHLHLPFELPILERNFDLAEKDELSVWDAEHPAPEGGEAFERSLLKLWTEIIEGQLHGLRLGDRNQQQQLGEILSDGWSVCLGLTTRDLRGAIQWQPDTLRVVDSEGRTWQLTQAEAANFGGVRVTVHRENKPTTYRFPTLQSQAQPLVANPRLAAAYTYGYNLPQFSRAAQRLGLTLLLLHQSGDGPIKVSGRGVDAALGAAGAFIAQRLAERPVPIELRLAPQQFAFAQAETIRDHRFVPGSARFWDFPGLLSCLENSQIEVATQDVARYEPIRQLSDLVGSKLQLIEAESSSAK